VREKYCSFAEIVQLIRQANMALVSLQEDGEKHMYDGTGNKGTTDHAQVYMERAVSPRCETDSLSCILIDVEQEHWLRLTTLLACVGPALSGT
jgi:hypothetical protein